MEKDKRIKELEVILIDQQKVFRKSVKHMDVDKIIAESAIIMYKRRLEIIIEYKEEYERLMVRDIPLG